MEVKIQNMEENKNKKKKKGRRAYLEHFQKEGKDYVYKGKSVDWPAGGITRKRALLVLWLCIGLGTVCAVADGCIPGTGIGNCAYVLLPYMVWLMLEVSMLWSLCRLSAAKSPIRDYVYKQTVVRLGGLGVAGAAFAGVTAAAQCVNLFRASFSGTNTGGALFLLLAIISAAGGIGVKKIILYTRK